MLSTTLARTPVLALAAVLLAGCEPSFPHDLQVFCKVVGEVDATPGLSASAKLSRIAERKPEYANYGLLETRDIWAEADAQKGEDRYRYLVAAAKKMKAPDWRCPAYGTLLNIDEVERMGGARAPARTEPAEGARAELPPPVVRPAASMAAAPKADKVDKDAESPRKKKAKGKRAKAKKTRS